jgi:hypothetical protein
VGYVLVSASSPNRTYRLNTVTNDFGTAVTGVALASRLAVDDGVYTYNRGTNTLTRTLLSDFVTTNSITVTGIGAALLIGDGDDLWVDQTAANSIALIDRTAFTLNTSYSVPQIFYGMNQFSVDAGILYVPTLPAGVSPPTRAALSTFDVASATVTNTYTLLTSSSLSRAALHDNGFVYVAIDATPDRIQQVNASTGAVVATCNLTNTYAPDVLRIAGGYLFVNGLTTQDVYRIDTSTMSIVNTYTIGSSGQPVITSDGQSVWISNGTGSTSIIKVDGATGTSTSLAVPLATSGGATAQYVSAPIPTPGDWVVGSVGW